MERKEWPGGKVEWVCRDCGREKHHKYNLTEKGRKRSRRANLTEASREKDRLRRQRDHLKVSARTAVSNALKSGRLVRADHCKLCRSGESIEAHHHRGYAEEFWLDVEWLCRRCHRGLHAECDELVEHLMSEAAA